MLSKADSRKKAGENSGTGKFINDLQTISKSLYADKPLTRLASSTASSRSKSVGKSQLPEPKTKPKVAKNNAKDSFDKDKKSSIWSWKSLKALTQVRNHRFNCSFSLLVHSIEGLPAYFDDVCLIVHWKRRDGEQMTSPIRVYQGVAEFEEKLTHSCSVYGSRSGSHHSAKYEAKHFLLYASVYDAPELDLGKHRVDLARLLPLTLEELEEEKNSGKWTTSFRLSGKARGATLNVSFGYVVIKGNSSDPCSNKNIPEIPIAKQNSARTEKLIEQCDQMEELSIRRIGSLPVRLSSSNQSAEDIKDLHEVLPISKSELSDSVNILYQKLDEEMSNASVENKLDVNPFSSHVDHHESDAFTPPDAGEKISETEWEISELSVIGKGEEEIAEEQVKLSVIEKEKEEIAEEQVKVSVTENGKEEIAEERVNSEEDPLKAAQASGQGLEIDSAVEVPLDENVILLPLPEETLPQKDEQSISTCNSKEKENDMCTKESLMKELETALIFASDLANEGLDSPEDESDALQQENDLDITSDLVNEGLDSPEDESDALQQGNYLDINSHYRYHRKGKALSLDDVTDSVASDFLDMLGIEHSPFGMSSESEPESPRERLLRQFEKDVLANGGLLNFDIDNDEADLVNDIPIASGWGTMSEDFHHSSMFEGFGEMSKIDTDALTTKTRASQLEDLETEALMREWGLNEKAFQHSPPGTSSGFGSPIDILPEDTQLLPSLGEGLGPFVQTKDGGFLRSMSPTLFRNAKSGGSLIMQVSGPVVVPAEMGSGVMDILQGLASVGIEKLSMQANKLMPLEDITGKTMQQIAWEAAPCLEAPERQSSVQHESEIMQNLPGQQKSVKRKPSGAGSSKSDSTLFGADTEYVSLEDLAPLAMDKIEALSVEGLRIQSGMSHEDAPSNISTQSIGEFSALKGKTLNVGGSVGLDGAGGLQLLDIKDNGEDVDGLMGLSLTLDEWMKLDSGEIDDDDIVSERTSKILAAHHASSLDHFRGRSKGEKRRGKGRKYGLLGNNFTVALMVQLRDPLRNYEPVGTPMLALIQVERVFVPPKPKIYTTVPLARNSTEEVEEEKPNTVKKEDIIKKPKEEKIQEEELIPQYKISEVHVAGLKTDQGKKKLWGSTNQQQSGSRWLLANGMGKKNKHPLMKSKAAVGRNSGTAASPMKTTTVQPGETLWSISSRVHGTGAKWKELAELNPHIRNPNVIFPNETIRLR
ncbi:hypothetical protein BUALT_Bualt16G0046400 [Buddleja alternifolia]|uniref:Protein PLASTID MOVEMENT IMPAIRED 1-RELATED 1 n=1 Tax=Buddleja alternifolia TaxID=168488 RepID=A0AAV6WGX2_9LAMI|nr:hypothetical protein BUALT_Bualt16G0046400 [Buddleja alternifolia]